MARASRSEGIDANDREVTHVVSSNPSFWRQAAARFGWTSVWDGMLGGVGGAVALSCAGFAAYMSAHPQPTFNGLEHLMIFAQPNYQEAPGFAGADPAADKKGIDYSVTGTIRSGSPMPDAGHRDEPIVTNFTLHYMHDGQALIVGKDDAVYQVSLGSMVPGVGRVVGIEELHGQWVVVTPRGLIVAR
jgi:hypothetical protein